MWLVISDGFSTAQLPAAIGADQRRADHRHRVIPGRDDQHDALRLRLDVAAARAAPSCGVRHALGLRIQRRRCLRAYFASLARNSVSVMSASRNGTCRRSACSASAKSVSCSRTIRSSSPSCVQPPLDRAGLAGVERLCAAAAARPESSSSWSSPAPRDRHPLPLSRNATTRLGWHGAPHQMQNDPGSAARGSGMTGRIRNVYQGQGPQAQPRARQAAERHGRGARDRPPSRAAPSWSPWTRTTASACCASFGMRPAAGSRNCRPARSTTANRRSSAPSANSPRKRA